MMPVAEEKVTVPVQSAWSRAWNLKGYRLRLFAGIGMLLLTFAYLPFFFQKIEQREGAYMADWLLARLPAHDYSLIIFLCIWGIVGLLFIRSCKDPIMLITAVYGFVMLYMMRLMTITLIPLNPPHGLIPLVDPISNIFYGKGTFITKDLFFSGHTSCQFMAFLCLKNKWHKTLAFISTLIVGSLVLVQHVHYTVDVVAALPLTFICYYLGKKFALNGWEDLPLKAK